MSNQKNDIADDVADYGHWMIVSRRDDHGRIHRLTAYPTAENLNNSADKPWKVLHESYLPFVIDYMDHGLALNAQSKSEARAYLTTANPQTHLLTAKIK